MPCFVAEPFKACKCLMEQLVKGLGCDFPIKMPADEKARYNLDLRERVRVNRWFRKIVDS